MARRFIDIIPNSSTWSAIQFIASILEVKSINCFTRSIINQRNFAPICLHHICSCYEYVRRDDIPKDIFVFLFSYHARIIQTAIEKIKIQSLSLDLFYRLCVANFRLSIDHFHRIERSICELNRRLYFILNQSIDFKLIDRIKWNDLH